ncbi:hypothetical protein [Streptomyces palmae]|uniref:Uncharacterized protein n=1 Tax=Streptomyces palmae TaxID=1701085 RepID=A0A4Z0HG31_9ACTN|nr:hypothetical protein [Streptomyces palmae]TGB19599.1 hypothetical protein E4099_00145 [Streptomyces palmae]
MGATGSARVDHAFSLKKAMVYDPGNKKNLVVEGLVALVQNGTAGLAKVVNGTPQWWVAGPQRGFPSVDFALSAYRNLGDFKSGFDTVFPDYDSKKGVCWVTRGDQVMRFDFANDRVDKEKKRITSMWSGVPEGFKNGFDAALPNGESTVWLFKGKKCVKLTKADTDAPQFGDPEDIADEWKLNGSSKVPLIESGIDAAIHIPGTTKGYLFRGDRYVTCDVKAATVTVGAALIRTYWHGVPYLYPVPDCSIAVGKGGSISAPRYLCYGKYCVPVKAGREGLSIPAVEKPKLIEQAIPALKGTHFASGIDHACTFRSDNDLCNHLFRGGKHAEFKSQANAIGKLGPVPGKSSDKILGITPTVNSYRWVYDRKPDAVIQFPWESGYLYEKPWEDAGRPLRSSLQLHYTTLVVSEARRVFDLTIDSRGNLKRMNGPSVFNWEVEWPEDAGRT